MLLATLIYFIDIKGKRSWSRFFENFGVNPLFLYVLSELLAIIISNIGCKPATYAGLLSTFPAHILPQPPTQSASCSCWAQSATPSTAATSTSSSNPTPPSKAPSNAI